MATDPVLIILALLFFWLLVRIRRSPSGSASDPGRSSVRIPGRKGIHAIESLPSRPIAFGAKMSVPDDSEGRNKQMVDLTDLSCTCAEFKRHRASLPSDSIGRVCRHLSHALRTSGATGSMDDLVRVIVEDGATRAQYFEVPLSPGRKVAVGYTPGLDRLDVFAPADGAGGSGSSSYRRFGYSRAGQRWLDEDPPPGGKVIDEAIRDLPWDS